MMGQLTFKKIINKLVIFSSPMVLNTLLNMLPSLVAMWILAQLGREQLAAAAIAIPTFYTVITVFTAGLYSVGIKVGHCYGENNNSKEIAIWTRNAFYLAVFLSIPASLIFMNISSLLLWFGQDLKLVEITKPFFLFSALSVPVILSNTVLTQYFSAIGHPRIVLLLTLINFPLVIFSSYCLVLGRHGFPALGLAGINCSVLIVDVISITCAIFIARFSKFSRPYRIFSHLFKIDFQQILELIKLGYPISLQVSGELAAMTIATYMLGLFGISALAASQIVVQYVMVFIMISMGLEQGVTILVSHAHGEKNQFAVEQITKAGILLIMIISLIFVCLFFLFSENLIKFYLNKNQLNYGLLVHYAINFMKIAAIYLLFDGIRHILTSTLRGLQDTKVPMKIGVGCLMFIGLPCAYLGGFILQGGPIMLRLSYVLGVIVATFWLYHRYYLTIQKIGCDWKNLAFV